MLPETALSWVTSSDLVVPLSRLTRVSVHQLAPQVCHRLVGGLGVNLGVWRLGGRAAVADQTVAWTLILKGWTLPPPHADIIGAWDTPYREYLLYRDGILDDLPPGIRAPRCLGTVHNSDGMWLWLEDLGEDNGPAWSVADYANAAHNLGRFNGAYLTGWPLPRHDSIFLNWLRHWVQLSGPAIVQMNAARVEPLVRQVYPPAVARTYTALWDRRHSLLDALDALPQSFCHRDAFRRNLTLLPRAAGRSELVAWDWEHAGAGVIGEEAAQLLAASVMLFHMPADRIDVMHAAILDAYTRGLQDAGWNGDPSLIRAGFTGAVALRTGVGFVRFLMPFLMEEAVRRAYEEFLGHDTTEITEQLETVVAWIAEQGESALRELLR